jgi:beta-lactamase class A
MVCYGAPLISSLPANERPARQNVGVRLMKEGFPGFEADYVTSVDPTLQSHLEVIDARIRDLHGMSPEQSAVGLFDVRTSRLAMVRSDAEFYAASVAKIGILLAYFQLRVDETLDSQTQHELGLMIKTSSNELAAKFSRLLGLQQVQQVLDSYHFYDAQRGGGLWVGKHYGEIGERIGSPAADHSHAATVRQLLRFYLLMEQGRLVSAHASARMREIFASPEIPHDDIKFVKGLKGRDVSLLRKWGSWEDWLHDTAIITGPQRHYVLAALTHHSHGDDYLVTLAGVIDDLMIRS